MRILIDTTITKYSKDTIVQPKHPLWTIKNTGDARIIINDQFYLTATQSLGVDASMLVSPILNHIIQTGSKEKVEIVNNTQFKVVFEDFVSPLKREFLLIETSFTIKQDK